MKGEQNAMMYSSTNNASLILLIIRVEYKLPINSKCFSQQVLESLVMKL